MPGFLKTNERQHKHKKLKNKKTIIQPCFDRFFKGVLSPKYPCFAFKRKKKNKKIEQKQKKQKNNNNKTIIMKDHIKIK